MIKNIAVIGVGALGKRHLQSLHDLGKEYNLFAVEVDQSTLQKLEKEFGEEVTFYNTISSLPLELEACVIATGSNTRRTVFEELIKISKVKNILFEKVLFQKKDDYYWVEKVLQEKGINAYVNCVRREWDSYKWLKEEMRDMRSFTYTVTGGEWGLCCNGIHMIDLMLYLADEAEYEIDNSSIGPEITPSKRKGFYELYGTLAGKSGKCKFFQISCMRETETPSLVLIESDVCNAMIDEAKQFAYISKPEDGWKWHKREFLVPYQSQLTAKTIRGMIDKNCNLPTYEMSMRSHLIYINALQECFIRNGWGGKSICPIT